MNDPKYLKGNFKLKKASCTIKCSLNPDHICKIFECKCRCHKESLK